MKKLVFYLSLLLSYSAYTQCGGTKIKKQLLYLKEIKLEKTWIQVGTPDIMRTSPTPVEKNTDKKGIRFSYLRDAQTGGCYFIIGKTKVNTLFLSVESMSLYEIYRDKKIKIIGCMCPDDGQPRRMHYFTFITDTNYNVICKYYKWTKDYDSKTLLSLTPTYR